MSKLLVTPQHDYQLQVPVLLLLTPQPNQQASSM